jgi:hypothetical protein
MKHETEGGNLGNTVRGELIVLAFFVLLLGYFGVHTADRVTGLEQRVEVLEKGAK